MAELPVEIVEELRTFISSKSKALQDSGGDILIRRVEDQIVLTYLWSYLFYKEKLAEVLAEVEKHKRMKSYTVSLEEQLTCATNYIARLEKLLEVHGIAQPEPVEDK